MPTVRVFEWPIAAESPLAKANADIVPEAFANGLRWLKSKGVSLERHNLREDKSALDANPTVKSAFEAQGPVCLPMVMVDDTIISVGGYPTRIELMEAVGMAAGMDNEFLGELMVEAAALGAAITANDFASFQQHYQRLQLLGVHSEDLSRAIQSATGASSGLVRDDMRTGVDHFLAFGPQGKPPKPRCTCGDDR